MDPYLQESEEWRRSMDENLMKEDSWLALAGLFWLEEGDNSIGTGSANHFVLPPGSGPDQIGAFILKDAIVKIQVLNDVDLLIDGENTGSPSGARYGRFSYRDQTEKLDFHVDRS